jgi:hypothetical protein
MYRRFRYNARLRALQALGFDGKWFELRSVDDADDGKNLALALNSVLQLFSGTAGGA